MLDMAEDSRGRLGKSIADQRLRLGLSVRAAAIEAKIDRNTWTDAEAGKRTLAAYNRAGVERALRWAHGSIEAILGGGDPVPTDPSVALDPSDEERLASKVEEIESLPGLSPDTRLRMIASLIRLYEEKAKQARRHA